MKIVEWNDGYPTEQSLQNLRNALNDENNRKAIKCFYDALQENHYYDFTGIQHIEVRGDIIEAWGYHTGGWSGNEDIIAILKQSWLFNFLLERYDRGGHYYFRTEEA